MDGSDFYTWNIQGVEFTFSDSLRTEQRVHWTASPFGDNVANFKGQLIMATSHKNVNGFCTYPGEN